MVLKENLSFLILAAGSSSRLGQPKQLVSMNGCTLLQKAIQATFPFNSIPTTVVLGAKAEIVKLSISNLPIQIVENKNWPEGMGSSLAFGTNFILNHRPETEAIIILLCDQYRLIPSVLQNIIMEWKHTNVDILASSYGNDFGAPALFSKKLFPKLISLKGKGGAKKIINAHLASTKFVEFENGIYDLDTPEDLKMAKLWLSTGK